MAFLKSKKRLAKDIRIHEFDQVSNAVFEKLGCHRGAIAKLESELQGTVVLPSDPNYNQDRQESNPAFQEHPQIIAYCEVFNDVKLCLAFAHACNLWVTSRSGGHSTAGYSVNSGMVIDTSRLSYVYVDPVKKHAVVGAGTNFGTVNAHLNDYRLHVPGGGCEDVCVAGYMQGGGYGFTSREYGMNCDNVIQVVVMLYDGRIVVANNSQNYDLFWAIRGGTGNNFGVLLEVTYQLHDLWWVWGFGIQWDIDDAPAALVEIQNNYMKTGASPKLGHQNIITTQNGQKVLLMRGIYDGTAEEGKALLEPLLNTRGAQLQIDRMGTYFELNQYLLEKPYPIPDLPHGAKEDKQSGYIADPLELSAWQNIIDFFKTSPNEWSTIDLEAYGGKINAYPVGGNAFIHRDVYADFFLDVFWVDETDKQVVVDWLDYFMDGMQPYFNGHAYQNYPRRTQSNYRWLYWGNYFNTLLWIKRKYDPDNFFHYQQSISPYPAEAGEELIRDDSASIFSDETILYEEY